MSVCVCFFFFYDLIVAVDDFDVRVEEGRNGEGRFGWFTRKVVVNVVMCKDCVDSLFNSFLKQLINGVHHK